MQRTLEPETKIFEMHAALCQTLAHPVRLRILNALMDAEKSVSQLVELVGVPQSNVSQHLAVLRERNIVTTRRDGVSIYYSIANPKIIKACNLIKEVLFEQIAITGELAKKVEKLSK
jgi:DNA-binding transcriptional ArsR family regulator